LLLCKGLGLANPEPQNQDQNQQQEHDEDKSPVSDNQHKLAECRGKNRYQNEYRHHERHDARHFATLELVTHQRDRYDAWSGSADTL